MSYKLDNSEKIYKTYPTDSYSPDLAEYGYEDPRVLGPQNFGYNWLG